MKRLFNTHVLTAIIFFCVGFLTNHLLTKINQRPTVALHSEAEDLERFPVNPDDFDQSKMLEVIGRQGASGMGSISHREDDKYFYYEIPIQSGNGTNQKLNVEIKNGMIRISEDLKASGDVNIETSSERMFSIDPGLDGDKAEVINEKDKIIIKIPKKL